MTTNAMRCEAFNDRLMAYLEHETDDATRAAIERHSVTCGECGALLADLRKLRVDAANLPPLQAVARSVGGIAARIEAPVVSIGATRPVERARTGTRRWQRAALLAASLVVATGIGYMAGGTRAGEPGLVGIPPVTPESVVTDVAVGDRPDGAATGDTSAAVADATGRTAGRGRAGALPGSPGGIRDDDRGLRPRDRAAARAHRAAAHPARSRPRSRSSRRTCW